MAHEVGAFLRCEEIDRSSDERDDLVEGCAGAPGWVDLRVSNVQPQMPVIIELERTPNILETVEVTATKSALNVGDVAAPTTVIDSPVGGRMNFRLIRRDKQIEAFLCADCRKFETDSG